MLPPPNNLVPVVIHKLAEMYLPSGYTKVYIKHSEKLMMRTVYYIHSQMFRALRSKIISDPVSLKKPLAHFNGITFVGAH